MENNKEVKYDSVKIVTKEYEISGQIKRGEGYRGRLSDSINEEKEFINLIDVEIVSRDALSTKTQVEYLCLNKASIIMLYPQPPVQRETTV